MVVVFFVLVTLTRMRRVVWWGCGGDVFGVRMHTPGVCVP